MERKIIEYFGRSDSGCWSIEAGADHIAFRSIWGDGMIVFPESKGMFQVQTIGAAAVKIVKRVLGRPELTIVVEEDGVEQSHLWFLKDRESKHTESTDILKKFVEECEKRHITNVVKSGYLSFMAGGEEQFRLEDGNKIKAVNKYEINLARFAEEIIKDYCEGKIDLYMNSDGYICE